MKDMFKDRNGWKDHEDYENVCFVNYIFGYAGNHTGLLSVLYALVLIILIGVAAYLLITSKDKITEISQPQMHTIRDNQTFSTLSFIIMRLV